jgi:hypothetical protein
MNPKPGFARDRRQAITSLLALLGVAGLAVEHLAEPPPGALRSWRRTLAHVLNLDERRIAPLCTARARAQLAAHFDACEAQLTQLQTATSPTALKSLIRRQIAADYARGNIVDVDGWQLASTEALVIALVASLTPALA